MIRSRVMQLLLLTATSVLLIGCGLKGDLYLEQPPADSTEPLSAPSIESPAEIDENPAAD